MGRVSDSPWLAPTSVIPVLPRRPSPELASIPFVRKVGFSIAGAAVAVHKEMCDGQG